MKTKWLKAATRKQRTATEEFLRRVHEKYPGRILSTVLFGSVARGNFSTYSDIDVLVVSDKADRAFERDVWRMSFRVSLDFDVILDPHVYSRELWESLCAKGRAFCRNVKREGIELKLQPEPATPARASQLS